MLRAGLRVVYRRVAVPLARPVLGRVGRYLVQDLLTRQQALGERFQRQEEQLQRLEDRMQTVEERLQVQEGSLRASAAAIERVVLGVTRQLLR
jgi:hypothetical protein